MAIQFPKKTTRIGPTFRSLCSDLKRRKTFKRKTETNRRALKFFRKQLGFRKPSSLLLDASFLFHCLLNNFRLSKLRILLEDPQMDFYTTSCVVQELRTYLSKFTKDVNLSNFNYIMTTLLVKCCHHKLPISSQDCVRSLLGDYNPYRLFLATVDKNHLENPQQYVPLVTVTNACLIIKMPSRYQRLNAQQLSVQLSSVERSIIDDETDLPLSADCPDFHRLLARLKLYQFVKIPVEGDGNCLHRALSEQMTHSETSYKKVRAKIIEQLMEHRLQYTELVDVFLRSLEGFDDEISERTYDEYVEGVSHDRGSGDVVCIQAAADRFRAKIVCLCSTENIAILEFDPAGLDASDRVFYLAIMVKVHTDSMYPVCTPISVCGHLYPL